MAIADDFSVAANGDIRYVGTTANYTVIAFHRFLKDLADDAQAAGNDILDITDSTPSERSTDNFVTLKSPYNIDDIAARHLYDGSIVQANGDEIYDGIVCFAAAGTFLYLIQNGKVVSPNFWTTGLNADAAAGISHRFMVKTRTAAADIDGRRLIGLTREWGKTYAEFKATTSRGNNTLALTFATDLNNATAIGTAKAWTDTTNTEGYRLIDVNNDGVTEPFYSEWNRGSQSINQFYERLKFLSKRAVAEDSGTDVGSDFTVGNGTITGQAQAFQNGANAQFLTRVHVQLKKTGSPTGNLVAKLYAHSGSYGTTSVPTGAALATSVNIDVTKLTTSYAEVEIGFSTQYEMAASTNYTIAIEYSGGTGGNYVQVRGLATTGTHSGNRSENTGAWAAYATDDLWFAAYGSPKLYGISGEVFRGPTHEFVVDTKVGNFSAVEEVTWSGGTGRLLAQVFPATAATTLSVSAGLAFTRPAGSFLTDGYRPGYTIVTTGFTNGGNNTTKVIATVTASTITVTDTSGLVQETGGGDETMNAGHLWIQLMTGAVPSNNDTITGTTSGATCLLNVTVTERSVATPIAGASTGSAIIGAYGLGIEAADLTANDKLFDLENVQKVPPNNATFTVFGLVASEDRVLVTNDQAGAIDEDQFTLDTTLSGAAETQAQVSPAIPSDTPASGTIRIKTDAGVFRRVQYSSFSGDIFTFTSPENFTADNATAGNNTFISYIDKLAGATSEAFTVVYNANRTMFVRVRDGGGTPIKDAETTGVLGSAGGSATINRVSDA